MTKQYIAEMARIANMCYQYQTNGSSVAINLAAYVYNAIAVLLMAKAGIIGMTAAAKR
jgi:hypothetical protein